MSMLVSDSGFESGEELENEIQGSLRYGGKRAAFGRDDVLLRYWRAGK
jgi:hypothetical protein